MFLYKIDKHNLTEKTEINQLFENNIFKRSKIFY